MALRRIVEQGEDCLNKKCRPVTEFNPRLYTLLDDLVETLSEVGGAGLAAPQVGVLRRVCLSVPGKWGLVTRPNYVRVQAQDRNGSWFELEGEGLMARCFCHELEHLDGHLYTEHIDRFLTDEEVEAYFSQEEGEG